MKIFHLSDLHIGKRVNDFPFYDEQENVLSQIVSYARSERPQAVVIAGDIYDKPVPSSEAVALFDGFLSRLCELDIPVFIIYGNHDSPERVSFGERLFRLAGVYISPVYDGEISPVTLEDEFGDVNFWLLPFVRPSQVRAALSDGDILSYDEAVRKAVSRIPADFSQRNVLITHQFVAGAKRSESEELSVGGTDCVGMDIFGAFDYTALGHLHSPQNVGSTAIRYCGSPLKYSFSEMNDEKSVTVVDLKEKGNIFVSTLALKPLHEMRRLRGTYYDLTLRKNYENTPTDDYLHIVLTDEEDIPDALGRLRTVYKNIMKLEYDNSRTRADRLSALTGTCSDKSPGEMFGEFYRLQNGRDMTDEQKKILEDIITRLSEEDEEL